MRLVPPVAFFALVTLSPAQEASSVASQPSLSVDGSDAAPVAQIGTAARIAKQQVDAFLLAARKGDTTAMWELLPSSVRQDIDGLVRDLGMRLDQRTCNRAWGVLRSFVEIAIEKESLAFDAVAARLLPRDADVRANSRPAFVALLEVLRDLGTSDLATLEGARKFDGRDFAGGDGKVLFDALLQMMVASGNDPFPALRQMQAPLVAISGERLTVQATVPNRSGAGSRRPAAVTLEFAKVDDRWIPAVIVDRCMPVVRQLRIKLGATPAKVDSAWIRDVALVLGSFEAALGHFEQARTKTQFDRALDRLAMAVDAAVLRML